MEGLLHAAVVHSTIARGRIASLDTAAAEAAPGVALVMTHRNAPRMKPPEAFGEGDGVAGSNLPVMQDDSIHWNGEAVAVVLAETQEQADHAAGLVSVTYAAEPAVTDFAAARTKARDPGQVIGRAVRRRDRRRREGAGRGPASRRPDLHDAVPEPQRDRAACRDRRLGGRQAHRARRHADDHQHRGLARQGVRPEGRPRCACCRRSSAAASAARGCGATRSWPPPRRSSPAGRCGWC